MMVQMFSYIIRPSLVMVIVPCKKETRSNSILFRDRKVPKQPTSQRAVAEAVSNYFDRQGRAPCRPFYLILLFGLIILAVMDNKQIARVLRETAQLLEIDGAIIGRYRSYEKAAELIDGLPESIAQLAQDPEKLKELPGIGERMAEHIQEILRKGDYSLSGGSRSSTGSRNPSHSSPGTPKNSRNCPASASAWPSTSRKSSGKATTAFPED